VIVLTLTGLNMLGVPPQAVGIIGAAMLLLGPLVWGFIRHTRGLPAFDNNAAAWRLPEPRPADLPRPAEHARSGEQRPRRGEPSERVEPVEPVAPRWDGDPVETPQSRRDAT
jgi:hypothetical protein